MSRHLQTRALCLTGAFFLSGCGLEPDRREVIARTPSPDGEYEAVHARDMGGGATVGPSDEVYVVKRGAPFGFNSRVASLERVCSMDARWLGDDTLAVSYRARRPQDNRALLKSAAVHVRFRRLGREPANGC